jgi:uncharacterized protein YaeQ
MGKPKEPKTKEDRLQEGITLLKSLKDAGIKDHTLSYMTLKQRITHWIHTGEPYEDAISMEEYGRMAEVALPRYNNRVAEIHLKVKPH